MSRVSGHWMYTRFLVLLALCQVSVASWADVLVDRHWEWNGFVTQGFFHSDHNNMFGPSDSGSFEFREVAINGARQLGDELFFSGQIMSRRAGAVNDGSPRIDYMLLDGRLYEEAHSYLGLRIGRIKNPFGFYNETRDVAFTRPGILLPQAVYFDIARDLQLSSDGISLYSSHSIAGGWVDIDFLIGKPNTETSVEYAYLSRDWPGAFVDGEGFMWRAVYNSAGQRWRMGFTMGRFDLEYDADEPALAFAPQDGHIDIDAYVLSIQYNLERWSFTSELAHQKVSWGTLGGVFSADPENRFESGFLQAEYRFNPEWSLIFKYETLYLDTDDRNGHRAEALFGKPAHTQYARDWTLGVGWKPSTAWLIRAEWHKVRGTAWLPEQDNPDQSRLHRNWNLLALQATYRF